MFYTKSIKVRKVILMAQEFRHMDGSHILLLIAGTMGV